MNWIKSKVVMLPTNEEVPDLSGGRLWININKELKISKPNMLCPGPKEYQHLYFISNEEIKMGDWCICSDYRNSYQKLGKVSHVGSPGNFKNTIQIGGNTDLHIGRENLTYCKKIIATTDKSLGLPQPSKEFIEAYVKAYNEGNIITEAMVEYEPDYSKNCKIAVEDCHKYMQNSVNCKGCSQAEIKLNVKSDNTISIRKVKDSWNREEVIKLLNDFGEHVAFEVSGRNYSMIGELNKWIKENL